jgi:hypothetical protein
MAKANNVRKTRRQTAGVPTIGLRLLDGFSFNRKRSNPFDSFRSMFSVRPLVGSSNLYLTFLISTSDMSSTGFLVVKIESINTPTLNQLIFPHLSAEKGL